MPYLQTARKWNFIHDTLHERRLPLTVFPDKSHLFPTLNSECDMIKDRVIAVSLTHFVANDRIVTRTQTGRELQPQGTVIHLIDLYRNNLSQLLDAALHLHGLGGLVAKLLYKVLHIGNFFLLILVGTKLLFAPFFTKHHILVIFHSIVFHPPAGDFQRAIGHIVNEGTVVTHQHHSLGTLNEKLLQPLNALDVKVVGRLIQ